MKKLLSLAALVFFGLAGAAHAATLDIFLNPGTGTSFTGITSSVETPGSLNVNVNLNAANNSSLFLASNAFIVNGQENCCYKPPAGNLNGAGNAGNYVAVESGGVALFNLASGSNDFGFSWGTIDNYNNLLLVDAKGNSYNINGSELAAALGVAVNSNTNANVEFIDPNGPIKEAVFSSTTNSFEFGNLSQSSSATAATPLPASLPLFGAALLGLVFFARRSRFKA